MPLSTILIVTTGHLCRNPRVLKEATALGEAGYQVTVLGIRNRKDAADTDLALTAKSPFRHTWVDMLGERQSCSSRLTSLARRAQWRFACELVSRCGFESAEALGPSAALLSAARRIPADLTIVHNEAAHWVGLKLLAEGRRVAADIEDWHSEDLLPEDRIGRPIKLLRDNEKALLHQARYVSTTSEALAEGLFARYGGQRPEVITNSFPLPSFSTLRQEPARNPPSFFWFSQTIGPGRGLETFLAAYALTKQPSQLTLLGQIHDDYRVYLLSLLPESLRRQVSFHGLVSPEELPRVIAQHDIGLALEQSHIINRDLTITNKILQYLGAALAVVATGTQGQREVLNQGAECGIILENLDNAAATAATLDSLLADHTALQARQLSARRLAETRYCWEQESRRLLTLVEHALKD